MQVEIVDTKVAIFRGALSNALREAAQWIDENNDKVPIWNINVESEDDGSYIVLVYFHESES